eukprot:403330977
MNSNVNSLINNIPSNTNSTIQYDGEESAEGVTTQYLPNSSKHITTPFDIRKFSNQNENFNQTGGFQANVQANIQQQVRMPYHPLNSNKQITQFE